MATKDDEYLSPKERLAKLFQVSLEISFPNETDLDPKIAVSSRFDDYQCNNAMGIWSKFKGKQTKFQGPQSVGQVIKDNLPPSDMMIESCSVAKQGFVNIALSRTWMAEKIQEMLIDGIQKWAPKFSVKRVVLDFSSPNVAKELHVGHLRSTIIGETLARVLEFSNFDVLRRNHVGDWGTQFGMLIQYLFEKYPGTKDFSEHTIEDLQEFYKKSNERFKVDDAFKQRARKAVADLQDGKETYHEVWTQLCDITRKEFHKIYERLDVELEEKGESFYNQYIPGVIDELSDRGLIEESDHARVIFVDGIEKPLIVVKSDQAYGYDTTDLAALWYRINNEKAEWIIYVTGESQNQHFDALFKAGRRAGWLPLDDSKTPKVSHVGFGLVLGEDGRPFRTRSTEVVRLVDLLDQAKTRSKQTLIERGKDEKWSEEELEKTAEAIGYGAVKYADLKVNRLSNYKFSYDQMLDDKGNTAVYLLYAHARICSIINKSGKDIQELKRTGKIVLGEPDERTLGLHLLRFSEALQEACVDLLPSKLCEYLYELSEKFSKFYNQCQVVGSNEETSRLLLCEATAVVMRKCFHLLGITPVYKI